MFIMGKNDVDENMCDRGKNGMNLSLCGPLHGTELRVLNMLCVSNI